MNARARMLAAMNAVLRGGVVMLAIFALHACSSFTSRSDYFDYRALRIAPDHDAKLVAMQRYVARHPDGRWVDEVQRERKASDRATFEAGKSTRAGIELYLTAFPDGEFATQAQSRLSAIAAIEARKREEEARAAQLAEERKVREAELSRTWVSRFFGYWVKTLYGLDHWGSPIEQLARANPDFSRAFGRPPRPRCSTDECVKYYESGYAVPVPGGTRLERTMRLVLRLRMDRGRVTRAELLLPSWGFSRWKELEERKPVVDGDPEARTQAVDWAIARITPLLDQIAPSRQPVGNYGLAEIGKPAISPTGEMVDTTAEDPSSPANRIQGTPEAAEPSVEEMVKPAAPEQTPDMEMAPLRVGPDGRPLSGGGEMVLDPMAVPQQQQQAPASGEVMEMAPLAVPPTQGAQPAPAAPGAGAAAPGAAAPPPAQPAPAVPAAATAVVPAATRAYRAGDLRLVVFSAASDAKAPAYDGIVIELADAGAAHGKGGAAAKPAATTKPAPKPAPAKPAPAPAAKPATPQPAPAAPGH
jgi:hypothetical protein